MVILIRGAEICAPEPLGVCDILVEGSRIAYLGEVDRHTVEQLPGSAVIDATGLTAVPGFIDPHVHITGGGGEGGGGAPPPGIAGPRKTRRGWGLCRRQGRRSPRRGRRLGNH